MNLQSKILLTTTLKKYYLWAGSSPRQMVSPIPGMPIPMLILSHRIKTIDSMYGRPLKITKNSLLTDAIVLTSSVGHYLRTRMEMRRIPNHNGRFMIWAIRNLGNMAQQSLRSYLKSSGAAKETNHLCRVLFSTTNLQTSTQNSWNPFNPQSSKSHRKQA